MLISQKNTKFCKFFEKKDEMVLFGDKKLQIV